MQSLAAAGFIDAAAETRVLSACRQTGEPAVLLLSKLGVLEEKHVAARLAQQLGLAVLSAAQLPLEPVLAGRLSQDFLKLHHVLPLRLADGRLSVAMANPFSSYVMKALELASGAKLDLVVAEASLLEAAFVQLYEAQDGGPLEAASADAEAKDLEQLIELAAEAPVIRFVNRLIQTAVDLRASDIHLEPQGRGFKVRLRVDGVMRAIESPPPALRAAILSRVKLMASLNIAERRLPQDGRLRATVRGKPVDLRVATTPTMHGESVVLRILDKGQVELDLARLGMGASALTRYLTALDAKTGIVLVTGPTGSGKTTTLYASLLRYNDGAQKILTVEDPIEYELPGVNQVQVKPQIGFTFANALRAFLRQDPDIMLVGEIRDLETAEIAAQAALTGHKVLSTLHTNDAASSITRLLDMGLPDFIVAATVEGVVAQRLVRTLCDQCKTPMATPPEVARHFEACGAAAPLRLYEPGGCERCAMTGFRGRIGVYEVLAVSDALRALIGRRAAAHDLKAAAIEGGMRPMFADGLDKVAAGVTTYQDLLRVCSPDG
ncbi:MAG: GspE/PulE family protein [Hyphomicrobiales bacterium]|nr:GspE/PulE family protein [Hyphomicrobiales bacterium]